MPNKGDGVLLLGKKVTTNTSRWWIWLVLAWLVSGCSIFGVQEKAGDTAQSLYAQAKAALDDKDYIQANEIYEQIEIQYPFGRYAQQAMLEKAYSYYKQDDSDNAIVTLDRFIKLFPRHDHIDYAYYLRALSSFNITQDLMGDIIELDPTQRDTSSMRESFRNFALLVERFPEGRYSDDGRQRMIYLRNALARHEIHVARFYARKDAHIAAVNRAKYVLEHFPRTPASIEALDILIENYRKLDMTDLAEDVERVKSMNVSDHSEASGDN